MNRRRLLVMGFVALTLGAFVSRAVYQTLQSRSMSVTKPEAAVVVAAHDIDAGAKLEDRDLRVIKLAPENLPTDGYQTQAEVLGYGVVLPITKGDFILPNKLAGKDKGAGLPILIPPGMRAVSVPVNEVSSVAGFAVPGTRVDVLLTGNPAGRNEPETTTVLEDVAVLTAGRRIERAATGESQSVPVITLLVSPEDAQKIALAGSEGRIQLTLRSQVDNRQENLDAFPKNKLFRHTEPPAVPHLKNKPNEQAVIREPPLQIEIIKGTHTETKTF
jgi:pilus assembly protein CpaB